MENRNVLEQLAMAYMMRNSYWNREVESYYVGKKQYFRISFWTPCVSYREFNGTLDSLINKLSH